MIPEPGLRAMVPMNIRTAADHLSMGNRISSLFVHLPVGAADPAERYRRQVEEAETLKSGTQHEGSSVLLNIGNHMPPVLHSFLARSLFATRLFNVTVTNVPGPQIPLYYFGSKVQEIWPLVPIAASHAVGLAVFSYDGQALLLHQRRPRHRPRPRRAQHRDRRVARGARRARQVHAGGLMFQVRIHGRGGQGVVTAAEMLSIAAFEDGAARAGLPHLRLGADRRPGHLVLPDRRPRDPRARADLRA